RLRVALGAGGVAPGPARRAWTHRLARAWVHLPVTPASRAGARPMIQVHKKTVVADGLTPVSAYAALRQQDGGGSFLLESVIGGDRWARYSILGYRPKKRVVLFGKSGTDPFTELSRLAPCGTEEFAEPADRFATAHVGMLAY